MVSISVYFKVMHRFNHLFDLTSIFITIFYAIPTNIPLTSVGFIATYRAKPPRPIAMVARIPRTTIVFFMLDMIFHLL